MQIKYNIWYLFSFKILRDVRGLNLYTGVQWNAIFNSVYNDILKGEFHEEHVCILPVENGRHEYYKDEIVGVFVGFEKHNKKSIEKGIEKLEQQTEWGLENKHLIPGKTIQLISAENIILNKYPDYDCIDQGLIEKEVESLSKAQTITVIFMSPMRLKRPEGHKEKWHAFYDPYYFDVHHFIRSITEKAEIDIEIEELDTVKLVRKNFLWIQTPSEKKYGGILGGFEIKGTISDKLKSVLVAGQYCGLGKNNSMGLGFYYIKESNSLFDAITDQNELLKILFSEKNIIKTIEKLSRRNIKLPHNRADFVNELKTNIIHLIKTTKENSDSIDRVMEKMKHLETLIIKQIIQDHLHEIINNQIPENTNMFDKFYSKNQFSKKVLDELKTGWKHIYISEIDHFYEQTFSTCELLISSLFSGSGLYRIIEYILEQPQVNSNYIKKLLLNLLLISFDIGMKAKHSLDFISMRFATTIVVFYSDDESDVSEIIRSLLVLYDLSINDNRSELYQLIGRSK